MRIAATTALLMALATTATAQYPVTSTFDTGSELWGYHNDANGIHWAASTGNPGGLIYASDLTHGTLWYFVAPAKFRGDHTAAYGLTVEYDLKNNGIGSIIDDDIVLIGAGTWLAYRFVDNPGTAWKHYAAMLREDAGWVIEGTSTPPTTQQFLDVLSDVTAFRIRGEYISGSDTGYLDNVMLGSGNQAPVAQHDSYAVSEDTTDALLDVLANDSDPDGASLTITGVTDPANGTAQVEPGGQHLRYASDADFFGTDSCIYTVADPAGGVGTATVTFTVSPVDDPPGAFVKLAPEPGAIVGREAVTFTWSNSADVDGDGLLYTFSLQIADIDTVVALPDTSVVLDFDALGLPSARMDGAWSASVSDGITSVTTGPLRDFTLLQPIMLGDASGSGSVDAFDASLVLRDVVGLEALSDSGIVAADVTGNGDVTAWDASFILSYVVGGIAEFPASVVARPAGGDPLFAWGAVVDQGDGTWVLPLEVNGGTDVTAVEVHITLAAGQGEINPRAGDAAGGWLMLSDTFDGVLRIALAGSQPAGDGEVVRLILQSASAADLIRDATVVRANEDPFLPVGAISSAMMPPRFALLQNAPNPFNPSTDIGFTLARSGRVTLEIWSATGQMVRRLVDDYRRAGQHTVTWEATDDMGRPVASGVYLYRIVSEQHMAVRRAVLTR